mgnify:CR=1 FL=1
MSEEEIDRKITVIFATDVVGYSKHMEADESETVKNLRACEKLLTGLFKKHKGRLFNTGGDSFLAEFSSAVSAVECAVEFQKAIEQRNSTEDATVKLKFRIGINSGDVIKEKDNLLGDGVNIAARLEALAQSGGITISKSVYDYVKGKTQHEFNDLGLQKVKLNEFHAFDLLLSPDQKRKITKKSNGYIGYIIVALALLLVGTGLFIYETQKVSKQIPIIASDRPNILILPFNSIGAEEDKYISEGITDTLIGTLLKYEQLKIQPLLTSKFISEQKLSNDKIISDYGVNYIVNGNLQVQGGELRLNIQLTDLMKNDVIWSERFDFELDNLFDIQDQLSEEILNSLSIELTIGTAHQDSRKYFKSVKNWRKLISARADFIQSTPESFQRMGETVAELYEEEPENPMVLVLKGWHQYFSAGSKEGALVAYDLAQEAIKLGPDLADAYMLASFIELNNPFQIVSSDQTKANQMAESRARKAAELDKTSPHNFGAIGNTLSGVGKVEESLSFYKKALEITPHAEAWIKYNYMNALVSIGEYEEGKIIATEISTADQFVNDARARALAVLAYIAHKEGEKKNAAAFIESLNSMALNTDFGSKLESIMWGFWNVKSNKEFIEDFKEAMIQFGIS